VHSIQDLRSLGDFGRCKTMSAKESKRRRSGRRPFSLKSAFASSPPPYHLQQTTLTCQQPLADEIRGNIAFGKCVRANKGEDMLLKKKLIYIFIYTYTYYTHLLLLRAEGNSEKYKTYIYNMYTKTKNK